MGISINNTILLSAIDEAESLSKDVEYLRELATMVDADIPYRVKEDLTIAGAGARSAMARLRRVAEWAKNTTSG